MKYIKKSPYADLAADAFQLYFTHPDFIEELTTRPTIIDKMRSSGVSDPTAAAVIYNEKALTEYAADVSAWETARRVIECLESEPGGQDKVKVLKAAYSSPILNGIGARVLETALRIPVDERTAWRWLRYSCELWAQLRGVKRAWSQ